MVFDLWKMDMWRFLVTVVANLEGCYVYFVGYIWLMYPSHKDQFVVVSTWVFGTTQPTTKLWLSCWMVCLVLVC